MSITSTNAKKHLKDKNFIFLDVRTLEERNIETIPGSIHIDIFNPDFGKKLDKLDKSKKYIVFCRSGNRSGYAVELMKDEGFDAKNLIGGMLDWD